MQWDENFDIGADIGTPVANDYQVRFRFTGKLDKLTLKIDRPKVTNIRKREKPRAIPRGRSVTPIASTECRPPA